MAAIADLYSSFNVRMISWVRSHTHTLRNEASYLLATNIEVAEIIISGSPNPDPGNLLANWHDPPSWPRLN